jgi:hypothetical protein
MRSHHLPILSTVLLLSACSSTAPKVASDECEPVCAAGYVCLAKTCRLLCEGARDCGRGQVCTAGMCEGEIQTLPQPIVESIDGDGSATPFLTDLGTPASHRLRQGLEIHGQNLFEATATLIDDEQQEVPSTAVALSDRLIYLTIGPLTTPLPDKGNYLLRVANDAGSTEAAVWVIKGEDGTTPSFEMIRQLLLGSHDIHTAPAWGRFAEAEEPAAKSPNVDFVHDNFFDPTASHTQSVKADPTDVGLMFELQSGVAGQLALTYSRVVIRAKVSDIADSEPLFEFRCDAIRANDTSETELMSLQASGAQFGAADTWVNVALECDFRPDDKNQFVRVAKPDRLHTTMATLYIDYAFVMPVAGCP